MTSPTTSSATSNVGQTTLLNIDALLGGQKWGGATGSGTTLSYSFPWTSSASASFAGVDGRYSYSELNEPVAAEHYGLTTVQQTAASNALQTWSSVANLVFLEVSETNLNVGDIRFGWTSASQGTSSGNTAWGWASYPNSNWPSAGDIWISTLSSAAISTDWSAGSSNFGALVHEVGHALGLKHSFEGGVVLPTAQDSTQYSVMSYTQHPHSLFSRVTHNSNGSVSLVWLNIEPDTPMLYDIAAMQFLYGANLAYKTGDDVYSFDPNSPFIRTLWDASGTDTISVANFSKPCIIDLQPGHFSKIAIVSDSTAGFNWQTPPPVPTYDGTDNLAIAYGCVIENAVGGSGDDILIGNDANNSLTGGAGNNTLSGGIGNDTATYTGVRASYTIMTIASGFSITSAAGGTDNLATIEYAQFADQTIKLGADDVIAPSVLTFSPADESTGVAVGSNMVMIFSEAIVRGLGSVSIKTSAGVTVATYDAATSINLSIAGSTLTINPTIDLSNSTSYTVEFAAGSIKDVAGNSYIGTTAYNFTTVAATSITPPTTSAQTKAKIYLGTDDSLIVSSSGSTVYGSKGNDTVTMASGATNVVLDQNVDRVNLPGASSNYTFKQTGNQINVYDITGSTLLTKVPVQGDIDGTVLSFSNGVASASLQAGGVMKLGGATASASAASMLTPVTTASPVITSGLTKAKVYLGFSDIFSISSSGMTLYGSAGNDTITIAEGITNVLLDQNVDRVDFSGASSSYTFKQTGNQINVYDNTGTTWLATTPVQGDADGTVLAFSNGLVSATLQTGGVMKIGGVTVSTNTPTALAILSATAAAMSDAGTGQLPSITLTGLSSAQDGALFGVTDLNTVFGA